MFFSIYTLPPPPPLKEPPAQATDPVQYREYENVLLNCLPKLIIESHIFTFAELCLGSLNTLCGVLTNKSKPYVVFSSYRVSGANNPERTTPIYFCHCVFTDLFIFKLIMNFPPIQSPTGAFKPTSLMLRVILV